MNGHALPVAPGQCATCAGDLPRTKSGAIHKTLRYCSPDCSAAYGRNHWWTDARRWRLILDGGICRRCGEPGAEVNHIRPLRSFRVRHSQTGCHHHQDNLETLCTPCHRIVTNHQAIRGRGRTKLTAACDTGLHTQCFARSAPEPARDCSCECGHDPFMLLGFEQA